MGKSNGRRERRWPWWAKLGATVLVVALVLLVVVYSLGIRARWKWQAYAAVLREEGHALTFGEIEKLRTPAPPGANSAVLLTRLQDDLQFDSSDNDIHTALKDASDYRAGLSRAMLESVGGFLEPRRAILDELQKLRGMPVGHLDGPPGLDENFWPLSPAMRLWVPRAVADLLVFDSALPLASGDCTGVAGRAQTVLHAGGVLTGYPSMEGLLIRYVVEARALGLLETAMRCGDVSREALREIKNTIDLYASSNSLKWALLGDRARWVAACEGFATQAQSLRHLTAGVTRMVGGGAGRIWNTEAMFRETQLRGTELLTELIEVADDPVLVQELASDIAAEVGDLPARYSLVQIMLGETHSRAIDACVRGYTRLLVAQTILAAEQFRLDTGRLPDALEALVPAYLEEIPIDPFDANPLGFVPTDVGILVYSVGTDLSDDGGIIWPLDDGESPPDVGMELLHPELRGVVIIEDLEPEETDEQSDAGDEPGGTADAPTTSDDG